MCMTVMLLPVIHLPLNVFSKIYFNTKHPTVEHFSTVCVFKML